MKHSTLIELSPEDLKNLMMQTLKEYEAEKQAKELVSEDKLYTINQVAKRLKVANITVDKYIERGLIVATKNKRITEKALNEYLGKINH